MAVTAEMKVFVTVEMNGQKDWAECPERGTAEDWVKAWLTARRKSYPRGLAIITYRSVTKAEVMEDRGG